MDLPEPQPLDYRSPASPTPRPPQPPLWPLARFGILSFVCLRLSLVTFFGICLIPTAMPRSMGNLHMIFFAPALLTIVGAAIGLSGIILDRRKWVAVLAFLFNLGLFFAINFLYPIAFIDDH